MNGYEPAPGRMRAVPLFPLPNVVLFPHTILPLHVFENRYQQMVTDSFDGGLRFAITLLKPGWEKDYFGRPPIEPVMCVGKIVEWERLSDGNYNLLLQGIYRAKMLFEIHHNLPYRVGLLQQLEESTVQETDLSAERRQMVEMFGDDVCGPDDLDRQFRERLAGPTETSVIADLMAYIFIDDVEMKQSLLEEVDVRRRVERTLEMTRHYRQQYKHLILRQNERPSMN
jgi:Lon protease-like protein